MYCTVHTQNSLPPHHLLVGGGRLPDATDIIRALSYTKSTSCDFRLDSNLTPYLLRRPSVITSSLDSTIMAGTQSQETVAGAEAFGTRYLPAILVGHALWRSASIGTPSSPVTM